MALSNRSSRFWGAVRMLKRNREDGRAALQTALAVLEAGWATIDEVRHANEWRHAQRPELGKLAMTRGKLSMAQVFAILGDQALAGRLFGETAVEMGLLNNSDVYELLLIQADLTPTLAAALATVGR